MFRAIKNIYSLIVGFFVALSNLLEITASGLESLNKELDQINKDLERKRLLAEREALLSDTRRESVTANRLKDD